MAVQEHVYMELNKQMTHAHALMDIMAQFVPQFVQVDLILHAITTESVVILDSVHASGIGTEQLTVELVLRE